MLQIVPLSATTSSPAVFTLYLYELNGNETPTAFANSPAQPGFSSTQVRAIDAIRYDMLHARNKETGKSQSLHTRD